MNPNPNVNSTGRTDRLVTNVLLAYTNSQFIADKIFPTVPNLVDETGLLGKLSNHHLRQYTSKRSLYDTSDHRMEFQYTQSDRYNIDFYDLEVYLPDRLQNQLQTPFDARRDSALVLQQALLLEREIAAATALNSTSILTNNVTLSGTSKFSDYDNSTPESVIETARDTIFSATGQEANKCVMSRKAANTLKAHPFFLDLAKRNAGQNVSNINLSQFVELFKSYFELEEVFIGKSIKITSKEGQTETKSNVWSDNVVLYNSPSSPSLFVPSFGYSFSIAGKNRKVNVRRHAKDKGDIVEVENAYQDMIVDANAAYLIKSVV